MEFDELVVQVEVRVLHGVSVVVLQGLSVRGELVRVGQDDECAGLSPAHSSQSLVELFPGGGGGPG